MPDIAHLQIKVDALEAASARKNLDALSKSSATAARATNGLTSAFKSLAAPLLATVSATAALSKIVNVQREFDKINATLITATGSAENASKAFAAIQQFATETPFDLQQVTESFSQMVNRGLNPSKEALTAYGDTASAMGKNLEDMVRAVAQATTGEFETLKSFGINAQKEGNKITFTFRGVSTTVKNTTQDIEKYLIGLGKNNFAGAMEERMKTLDGAISNLGDEWNKLFLNVSESGVGDSIADGVRVAIDALSQLNAMIKSGEMEARLDAIGVSFGGFSTDATSAINIITDKFNELINKADLTKDDISEAFGELPQNIRAFIQLMTIELAAFIEKTSAYGKEISENLMFWKDETFDLDAELKRINDTRRGSVESILAEKNATDELAKKNRELADARRAGAQYIVGADQSILGSFGVSGAASQAQSTKEADTALKNYKQTIESLFSDTTASKIKSIEENILLVNKAVKDGLVTNEQASEKLEMLAQERAQIYIDEAQLTINSTEKATDEVNEMWVQAARSIQQTFADYLYDPFKDGLEGMVSGFADALRRMVANAAAAQLGTYIFGDNLQGGQIGGLAASLLSMSGGGGGIGDFSLAGNANQFMFDKGGYIPAGGFGIVGERGPELVRGPANVTSRKDTAKMMGGHTFNFSFGAGTTEADGRKAGAAAAREVLSALNRAGRYV